MVSRVGEHPDCAMESPLVRTLPKAVQTLRSMAWGLGPRSCSWGMWPGSWRWGTWPGDWAPGPGRPWFACLGHGQLTPQKCRLGRKLEDPQSWCLAGAPTAAPSRPEVGDPPSGRRPLRCLLLAVERALPPQSPPPSARKEPLGGWVGEERRPAPGHPQPSEQCPPAPLTPGGAHQRNAGPWAPGRLIPQGREGLLGAQQKAPPNSPCTQGPGS